MLQNSINSGDTAWMLVSTGLVFLMTPGLALFYSGMVRAKNVVATLFQCFSAFAVIGLVWAIIGYSLVFSGDSYGIIGNLNWFLLNGVGMTPHETFGPTIPHILFMAFQMMFAVISPALITGAFAERIHFKAWIPFMVLWVVCVYCPLAHWVWGPEGWIGKMGGLDFAGGLVVHISSGFSALAASVVLGHRHDFKRVETRAHSLSMVALGTALLIFGWFGFNGGSALAANGLAAHAFVTSFLACGAAYFSWMMLDWQFERPTFVGSSVGAVAGLVAITPGAGFVSVGASILIGLLAGIICNLSLRLFKAKLHIDDTLDVFACHGVGGVFGTIATGLFASSAINPAATDGLFYGGSKVFYSNSVSAIAVAVFCSVMTVLILKFVSIFTPLRVSQAVENSGLDALHGESIMDLHSLVLHSHQRPVQEQVTTSEHSA